MHLRLEWATRMHLLWTQWNPVKLRAVCFWAPGAVAFTRVQCYSRRRVPASSCSANPAQRALTQPGSALGVLYSLCLNVHQAQKAISGAHFGLNFEHPSRELCSTWMSLISFYLLQLSQILGRDLSALVVCSSVTFRRQSCCWAFCSAENWGEEHRARSLQDPMPNDLLSLMQKGRAFPSLPSTPLAWL